MLNKYSDDSYVRVLKSVYEGNDVEIIAKIDTGEMYEWDIAVVYRVYGVDNYYVGSDSGCSCDYYGENAGYHNLMQFSSRRALLNFLRNHKADKFKMLHSTVLSQRG